MDIISVALKRHSTKAFDASKKLTPEQAEQIKTLLQYSPSSTNSQPWHFIVASTEEGKARVAKSAAGNYVFNERKILDASHVVVFCAKTAMDDAWLKLVVDQEDADGRFATPEAKAANDKGRKFFADMHRKDLHDDAEWMAKQVYLNVGNFLLGVAALGPVSYTHLDVYKRQALNSILRSFTVNSHSESPTRSVNPSTVKHSTMTAARAYFVSMFILPPCEEGTTIQIVRVWSGSPRVY